MVVLTAFAYSIGRQIKPFTYRTTDWWYHWRRKINSLFLWKQNSYWPVTSGTTKLWSDFLTIVFTNFILINLYFGKKGHSKLLYLTILPFLSKVKILRRLLIPTVTRVFKTLQYFIAKIRGVLLIYHSYFYVTTKFPPNTEKLLFALYQV